MKNEDLFYAMNFLDEDLIAEADKAVTKAVVTPVKKKSMNKAKIVPLVASFAAAAAVLVIGGVILLNSAASSSSSTSMGKSSGEREENFIDSIMLPGENSDEAYSTSVGNANSLDAGSHATITMPNTDSGSDSEESEGVDDAVSYEEVQPAIDIYATQFMFDYDGGTYILTEELSSVPTPDDIRGEELGTVDTTDNEELEGAVIYAYNGQDDMVIVYVPDTDQYFTAMRLST